MKNPCEARKIKDSQILHKIISTHLLTLLIIGVIVRLEQNKSKLEILLLFWHKAIKITNNNHRSICKEEGPMLVPSIFNTSLSNDFFNDSFDNMFRDAFRSPFGSMNSASYMSTDIQDLGDKYQLEVELPGYEKKDLKADLKDGYLTISAERNINKEEKDEKGKFVRRERYMGSCQRSFFVGKEVRQEDIHASFENGILKLTVPKKEIPAVEDRKYITIK